MIPTPNLDDRTFQDIVDEALRLIPRYCPEWTNLNASDPGVTLIELFAWMTEMIIYRLNKVPDKNYLAFLDLMGVRLQPPQPSRALLTFDISDKAERLEVPRGTRVATQPTGGSPPVVFETASDLVVARNRIVSSFSRFRDTYRGNGDLLGGTGEGIEVFGGVKRVERYLYLGDHSFGSFREPVRLMLRFDTPVAGRREYPRMLEWEVWTGEQWRELEPLDLILDRNCIAFEGPPDIAPGIVNEIETCWVRGRLIDVPESPDETRIDTIKAKVEVVGEGVSPDLALVNPEETFFKALDFDKNFFPFDREPQVDTTFYVASEEFFSQPGAEIRIESRLTDPSLVEPPGPSDDLILRFEYHTGKRWKALGRCGAVPDSYKAPKGFSDTTACFTRNGSVTFTCPRDLAPFVVNGVESRWIRCRIERGGYGEKGSWVLQGDTWEWVEKVPLRPPSLRSLTITYAEPEHSIAHVLSYNDFLYTEFTTLSGKEFKDFQPFEPVAEDNPAFYLGFASAFPHDAIRLYLNVLDSESDSSLDTEPFAASEKDGSREQTVVWEYWSGRGWSNLYPRDGTRNFSQSGFLEFTGPKDHRTSRRFGDNLYWLRARLEMGGFDQAPRLTHVLLNTTDAYNRTTQGETILGSSAGTPNQSFRFPSGPVLDGEELYVVERDTPPEDFVRIWRARHAERAVFEVEDGYGVLWERVDSFSESTSTDRHYTKDVVAGEVRFGDGVRGMVPPKGDRNVRCRTYQVGGGEVGNVPARSITIPKQNIAYLAGVTNYFPSSGGSDLESVDEVKERGPHLLKSRNRAVTAEDFEWLARQASNGVARVKALPSTRREGEVTVIIVPKVSAQQGELKEKPIPSTELIRRVKRFLEERKLITTLVNVVKPRFQEVMVEVVIARRLSGSSDRIKMDVRRLLERFLHPLTGGRDGQGWPFGRSVLKVDLFRVVERVEGVEMVERVRVFSGDRRVEVDQLRLRDDQLPFLTGVEVTEQSLESML